MKMQNNIWMQILFKGEVDVEQATQVNLINHIKALVHIAPIVVYENGTQRLGPPKYLLTWDP